MSITKEDLKELSRQSEKLMKAKILNNLKEMKSNFISKQDYNLDFIDRSILKTIDVIIDRVNNIKPS